MILASKIPVPPLRGSGCWLDICRGLTPTANTNSAASRLDPSEHFLPESRQLVTNRSSIAFSLRSSLRMTLQEIGAAVARHVLMNDSGLTAHLL
jgi:hypothetical protein